MTSPASFSVACNRGKSLVYRFCHKCLKNRYGNDGDAVEESADWICPRCRGICMKKKEQLITVSSFDGFSSASEIISGTPTGGSSAEEPIDLDENQVITDRIEMAMDKEIDELKNRVLSRITKSDVSADRRTLEYGHRNQTGGSSGPGSSPEDAINVDELHELQMKKEMERDREIERLRKRIAETDAAIKRLKSVKALIHSDQGLKNGLISTH